MTKCDMGWGGSKNDKMWHGVRGSKNDKMWHGVRGVKKCDMGWAGSKNVTWGERGQKCDMVWGGQKMPFREWCTFWMASFYYFYFISFLFYLFSVFWKEWECLFFSFYRGSGGEVWVRACFFVYLFNIQLFSMALKL